MLRGLRRHHTGAPAQAHADGSLGATGARRTGDRQRTG